MPKEVSNKVVIILVLLTVIISILSTYLVYYNSRNIQLQQRQFDEYSNLGQVSVRVVNQDLKGQVAVNVINPQEENKNG